MAWQSERDILQHRIIEALRRDHRVVACWLAGSQGRGTSDEWSDIDLGVVLADDAMQPVIERPVAFVESIIPVMMFIEAPHAAPPNGAFLLTLSAGMSGPQEVDWYWYPESSAQRPIDTVLQFETRPIPLELPSPALSTIDASMATEHALREAVQMAFITGKRIRRQDSWSIVSHLRHLAECIGRAEWIARHGTTPTYADARQFAPALDLPQTTVDAVAMLESLVERIDALSTQVSASTRAAVPNLRRWLEDLPHPDSAEPPPVDTPSKS